PFDFPLAVALSLGGAVAILGMWRVRQQSWPFMVGTYSGLVQALAVISIQLMYGKTATASYAAWDFPVPGEVRAFLEAPSLALAGGLVSGAAMTIFLPAVERFFGIITERRLLALTDPNNKLLVVLRNNAPGTYTHTLRVADLVSAAAEAIGADSLLARV